jgi:hypothetical protein
MFQKNSIKTHQNVHVNVAIAYKENDVLSNVHNQLGHLKHHKTKVIICVENGEPYNK